MIRKITLIVSHEPVIILRGIVSLKFQPLHVHTCARAYMNYAKTKKKTHLESMMWAIEKTNFPLRLNLHNPRSNFDTIVK